MSYVMESGSSAEIALIGREGIRSAVAAAGGLARARFVTTLGLVAVAVMTTLLLV